jgi:hypothetical protein
MRCNDCKRTRLPWHRGWVPVVGGGYRCGSCQAWLLAEFDPALKELMKPLKPRREL